MSILSQGKLLFREKTLAVKSGSQEIGKSFSGKHADCRFNQFTKYEWMSQTEDKFGCVLKGREERGEVVGNHFFYREIFGLYLNRVKICSSP